MENLMIFESNKVEVFEFNNQILFNPYDVGKCLDLTENGVKTALTKMNAKQVIKLTNSKVAKYNFRKLHNTGENFLTESGVYKLIFKSNKPNAEKFSDWVTDEVLPTIRKTGQYQTPKKKQEKLSSVNNAARTILPVLEKAGMKAEKQVYMLKQLYSKAGVEIPTERIQEESRLYDKGTIAKKLGVLSNNNNPHAQAIGAIISKLDIQEDEKELTSFERNGHVGTEYQYKESVIFKIEAWLQNNDYPTSINKDGKSYKVNYKNSIVEVM